MGDYPNIPGHTIKRLLGKGGMGAVYLAQQDALDRIVALKVTLATLGELDETFAHRFVKEAKTTASLKHPNIITVFESGEAEGRCYMSMEYIEGGSLADLLEQRRMSVDEVIDFGKSICSALDHAHRAGFVHRDIKPENIMLRANGEPVVTDFGIVKSIHGNTNLTGTNATIGSPMYMSPEQLMGEEDIDGRADLYSLGVVLFEMLEGRPPFSDEQEYAVGMKHLTEEPPPLSPLNARFQGLIRRLLKKRREQRFESAGEVIVAMERLRSHVTPAPFEGVKVPRQQPRARSAGRPSTGAREAHIRKASLGRRVGSRFTAGRMILLTVLVGGALIWGIWLRDINPAALNYEIRGFFGDPMEQYMVGRALFDRGDRDRARFWMDQARRGNYPGAGYELGLSYRYEDEGRAIGYLEAEISNSTQDSHDRNAGMMLGHLLCNGRGEEDCSEAIRVFELLAEDYQDVDAMYRIGEIHYSFLKPPDYGAALAWFEQAASAGTGGSAEKSMLQIARMYDEGLGVEKERQVATSWIVRAATSRGASRTTKDQARRRCQEEALMSDNCRELSGRRRP